MKKLILSFLLSGSLIFISQAQQLAKFDLELNAETSGINVPVTISLEKFNIPKGTIFSLAEISGNNKVPVPFQIDKENNSILFILKGSAEINKKRSFELLKAAAPKSNEVKLDDKDGSLTFVSGNKNLLRYFYKTVYPPPGIDTNYKRSGFIHPLWTPHGQELTRIQPTDHYHHYGIWNPWTHVLFEKDTVDFWNIKGKQGTVRFAKFTSTSSGPVFAEFEALHEHVRFYKDGSEKVALNELQKVRVYKPEENSDYFIVDVTSEMKCATPGPFLILAYRYAGFGWRATEFWDKNNMEVLTSEGKTRVNTDNSKARWILSQGALPGNEYGGMVMMSYPGNYNHPEPLRIWDLNANGGRGDYFANFAPTKDKDWLLEPGKKYVLKYRLLVYSGKFDEAKAESAWQNFSKSPEIIINYK